MIYKECKKQFMRYVQSYATESTIAYYEINFEIFEKFLGDKATEFRSFKFSRNDFMEYMIYLRGRGIKNTSIRTYMRAIKSFLRWLYFEGIVNENPTERIRYPKLDKRQIVPLTLEEIKKIDTYLLLRYNANRNLAIMYLMLECGLRLGEICRLNRNDIDSENGCIYIRNSKNGKSRTVPLSKYAYIHIDAYWEYDRADDTMECAFADFHNKHRITESAIKTVFHDAKEVVPRVHAHLFRHTFATSYIMNGGNLEVLRLLMGHDSYNVTKDYLHISAENMVCGRKVYTIPANMLQAFKCVN